MTTRPPMNPGIAAAIVFCIFLFGIYIIAKSNERERDHVESVYRT